MKINKLELFRLYDEIKSMDTKEYNPDLIYIINLVEKNYFRYYQQHLKLKKKIKNNLLDNNNKDVRN